MVQKQKTEVKESMELSRGNSTGYTLVLIYSVARDLGLVVLKILRNPEEIVIVQVFVRSILYYFFTPALYS